MPTRPGHRAAGARAFAEAGVARAVREDSLSLRGEVPTGHSVGCIGGGCKPRPLTSDGARETGRAGGHTGQSEACAHPGRKRDSVTGP